MDEARALFFSLPSAAQIAVRAAPGQKNPVNFRRVARAAYPYVQTLADAQGIGQFLASEELVILDCSVGRVKQCVPSQTLRKIRTLREYVTLKDGCNACAAGHMLAAS